VSRLVLFRHAQASFDAGSADGLSEAGRAQARRLGEALARRDERFDEVYHGPRPRHRGTTRIVGECLAAAGLPWPAAAEWPAFDEHHVDRLLKASDGALLRHPALVDRARAWNEAPAGDERERRFWKLFEAIHGLWVGGAPETDAVESWESFRRRVRGGIDRIRATPGRGRSIAVFTSVGPITVAIQQALGCDDATAVAMGWRVGNATATRFVFSGERFTLEAFNESGHLDDPALRTYR
jgi:broad specificity phosphatase PhoE